MPGFLLRDDANIIRRNAMDQKKCVTWRVCGQPTGGQEAAKGLVIPPPLRNPCPLFYFIIPSTSPWQTWSALYRRATGYLSSPPPPSFSFPVVLIPFVIYSASVSVSLTGTGRLCQARPRGSEAWQDVVSVSPWWPNLVKPLNGFRHIC